MGQIIRCPVCYEWVGIEEADAHHERHRVGWTFKNVEVHDRHHLESDSTFPGKITVGDYTPTNEPASASVPHRVIRQGKGMLVKTCYFQARCTCWDDIYTEPDDQVLSAPILRGEA